MKRRVTILLAALATIAAVAVSCGPARKIAVAEVAEPYFNGLSSVHTRAVVVNSSAKGFAVERAMLTFSYKGRELAAARLMLPIEVAARSVERVRVDLKLESASLSNLQTLQRRAQTNPSQLSVSVSARVSFGRLKRDIELEGIPYSAIIANFGPIIGQ